MDSKKYPGYNADDTKWDAHHKATGQMTNREFFTSNAKGGFYEGMEYDEQLGDWVPDAKNRADNYCSGCHKQNHYCECNDYEY